MQTRERVVGKVGSRQRELANRKLHTAHGDIQLVLDAEGLERPVDAWGLTCSNHVIVREAPGRRALVQLPIM